MDFLGLIINGLVMILVFMAVVYIAMHNPGEVTVIAILAVFGSVLFLVRG
jgi:hypothetical protein